MGLSPVAPDGPEGRQARCGHRAEAVTSPGSRRRQRAFGDGFLVVEGAGRLDKVSVTQVGNTGWVAEGKLSYIIGPNKGKDPGPFTLKPVTLK